MLQEQTQVADTAGYCTGIQRLQMTDALLPTLVFATMRRLKQIRSRYMP